VRIARSWLAAATVNSVGQVRVLVVRLCSMREGTTQWGRHDDPVLPDAEEKDKIKTMRKRRLTMVPQTKTKTKMGKSMEDLIIERGIRDGSINWMVVAATSSLAIRKLLRCSD
jgi:hypothetical protein